MSIGNTFDAIKDGFTDTLHVIEDAYKPGKMSTLTKVVLTLLAVAAIFYVVGRKGEE